MRIAKDVCDGDAEAAAQRMDEHLQHVLSIVLAGLQTQTPGWVTNIRMP